MNVIIYLTMNVEDIKRASTDQREELNDIFEKEKIIERQTFKLTEVLKLPKYFSNFGC